MGDFELLGALGGSCNVYASSMGAAQRVVDENWRVDSGRIRVRRGIRGGMVEVCGGKGEATELDLEFVGSEALLADWLQISLVQYYFETVNHVYLLSVPLLLIATIYQAVPRRCASIHFPARA